MVLVFHAQNAAFAVDRLNREVRERYPSPGELPVASLVPPFSRRLDRMTLEMSYRRRPPPCHARPIRRTTS
jgi:hypothetical protein